MSENELDTRLKQITSGCNCGSICQFCSDQPKINADIKAAFLENGWTPPKYNLESKEV